MEKKYIPKSLTEKDKKKQIESIKNKTVRPKLDSFKSKRSTFVIKFEKKYGTKITDNKFIYENIISKTGVDQIKSKARGAYFSSGSRPNQTTESWANARLASVIVGGKARKIDLKIWNKYKK